MYVLVTEEEIKTNPNYYNLGKIIHEKYWKLKESNHTSTSDKCILCGEDTPYSSNTHIDSRVGYVEGAGQSCFKPNKCNQL